MRVLIARLSAMGDVVHGIGAIGSLCAARPDLEVGWVVQRPFAPLLRDLGLARVELFDRGHGPGEFLRVARALRTWRPAVALDLQGNWKSAMLCRASGAPRRIGAVRALRNEPSSAWLMTERIAVLDDSRHPADLALALARCLAPELTPLPVPVLCALAEELEYERAALRALGIDPARPFRIVVWADPHDHRSIRPPAIVREIAASREPVLLLAGPDDPTPEVPPGTRVLAHARGELRRLIALGAVAREADAIAVGPDKGATHVLNACGVRTTVVHGPTDPARTAPRGARVVRSPTPPSCMPCDARRCTHPQGPVCTDVAPSALNSRAGGPSSARSLPPSGGNLLP